VAGQFGAWTPIGAEATATGYEVAWKVTGADQYTVWKADSNGNYVSSLVGVVSGSNPAFEALEPSFHQDLNGDGVIGVPTAPAISGISPAPVSQAASVIVASNDTFVFRPGIGADVVANAGSADTMELDGFSSVTSNAQLTALLHDAQTGQSQALFQSTNNGHDTVINLGNHDSITLTNVHIADLHASNFIIR
jgi:serralysin